MPGLHAITKNTTGQVLEWGGGTLRSATGGETAYVDVIDVASQSVIDANGPKHTKVVANAFVAMTQGEQDVVDAAVVSNAAAAVSLDRLNYKRAISNVTPVSSASGTVEYDCSEGNDFRTVMNEDITTVSVLNPPGDDKTQIIRIVFVQESTARTLPGSWADVDWWLSGGAPVMPTVDGKRLMVTIYSNGSEVIGSWAAEA